MSKHNEVVHETPRYEVKVYLGGRYIDNPLGTTETDEFGGGPFVIQIPDPDRGDPREHLDFPYSERSSGADGYVVINKTTLLREFLSPSLPEAIYEAERMTDALELASWKWFAVRRDLMAQGKIKDDNEVMLNMMSGGNEKEAEKVPLLT